MITKRYDSSGATDGVGSPVVVEAGADVVAGANVAGTDVVVEVLVDVLVVEAVVVGGADAVAASVPVPAHAATRSARAARPTTTRFNPTSRQRHNRYQAASQWGSAGRERGPVSLRIRGGNHG